MLLQKHLLFDSLFLLIFVIPSTLLMDMFAQNPLQLFDSTLLLKVILYHILHLQPHNVNLIVSVAYYGRNRLVLDLVATIEVSAKAVLKILASLPTDSV